MVETRQTAKSRTLVVRLSFLSYISYIQREYLNMASGRDRMRILVFVRPWRSSLRH